MSFVLVRPTRIGLPKISAKSVQKALGSRIVKYSACVKNGRRVLVKIAADGGGVPMPLSAAQVAGFKSYLDKIQPAGVQISIINSVGDYLNLSGTTIYYDPNQDEILVRSLVEQAIMNYIKSTNFKGEFLINQFIDQLQRLRLQGVQDVVVVAQAKVGATPYQNITRNYLAYAGYLQIDSLYPLSTAITYIPTL